MNEGKEGRKKEKRRLFIGQCRKGKKPGYKPKGMSNVLVNSHSVTSRM